MTGIRGLQATRRPAAGWSILFAAVLMAACQPGLKPSSSAAVAEPLSRPERVELVVKVESGSPGYLLQLQSGKVLVLDPEWSETLSRRRMDRTALPSTATTTEACGSCGSPRIRTGAASPCRGWASIAVSSSPGRATVRAAEGRDLPDRERRLRGGTRVIDGRRLFVRR